MAAARRAAAADFNNAERVLRNFQNADQARDVKVAELLAETRRKLEEMSGMHFPRREGAKVQARRGGRTTWVAATIIKVLPAADGKERFTVQYADKRTEDREARFIRDGAAVVNKNNKRFKKVEGELRILETGHLPLSHALRLKGKLEEEGKRLAGISEHPDMHVPASLPRGRSSRAAEGGESKAAESEEPRLRAVPQLDDDYGQQYHDDAETGTGYNSVPKLVLSFVAIIPGECHPSFFPSFFPWINRIF